MRVCATGRRLHGSIDFVLVKPSPQPRAHIWRTICTGGEYDVLRKGRVGGAYTAPIHAKIRPANACRARIWDSQPPKDPNVTVYTTIISFHDGFFDPQFAFREIH